MKTLIGAVLACAMTVARAEPASGVTPTLLSRGTFPEFKVKADVDGFEFEAEAKPAMDIVVRRHTYARGGSTGWHVHPGPVFITVQSGHLTVYEYDGTTCTSIELGPGDGYVDDGHGHMIRNERDEPAVDISVITAPVGLPFRDDLPRLSCGN
jgi:quercetin dioxygenase-like cupin family protein